MEKRRKLLLPSNNYPCSQKSKKLQPDPYKEPMAMPGLKFRSLAIYQCILYLEIFSLGACWAIQSGHQSCPLTKISWGQNHSPSPYHYLCISTLFTTLTTAKAQKNRVVTTKRMKREVFMACLVRLSSRTPAVGGRKAFWEAFELSPSLWLIMVFNTKPSWRCACIPTYLMPLLTLFYSYTCSSCSFWDQIWKCWTKTTVWPWDCAAADKQHLSKCKESYQVSRQCYWHSK
jgi:hypothetical protein